MPADPALASELALLRSSRVLFSHQSVGHNLLTGLQRLAREHGGVAIPLLSIDDADRSTAPGIIDLSGGQNGAPASKLVFFADTLHAHPDAKPALAFLKLCFVDFDPNTDVGALFAEYQPTLSALKREHPEITFAHVTTPLTRRPSDLRSRVLRVLGRQVWEDAANVKRCQWNERLLRSFSSDPIFDLARVESTRPDGSRESFSTATGGTYYSLVPAYTDDGGHLNELGQNVAARELVRFVAAALRARGSVGTL